MRDIELYRALLGLTAPWMCAHVIVSAEYLRGSLLVGPERHSRCEEPRHENSSASHPGILLVLILSRAVNTLSTQSSSAPSLVTTRSAWARVGST